MSGVIELPMAPPGPRAEEVALDGDRRFRVDGMDCAACAQTVQQSIAALSGVRRAAVSFGTAMLIVDGDAADAAIVSAVVRAGYRARPVGAAVVGADRPAWRRDARALSASTAVVVLFVAVAASLAGARRIVAEPIYLLSMIAGGWPIARAAMGALRRLALDMNVLMSLAAVGAVAIGAYAEGAWVLVLFSVGTSLEAMALHRSRRAVDALRELAPTQASVLVDGVERIVPVGAVAVGDQVVVRPGERLPVDGTVVAGASSIDQSPITGESVPVDVTAGADVFAGTLNVQGALTIRTTKVAAESTLSRIAVLVEEAQGSRAPSERFIDQFARVYTPLVLAASFVLATVPPLLFGADPGTWVYRALALLIVACPCSLVISVPVAVVSAVGGAARRGVLIKGGQALEDLARVTTVALDKTGTLTVGVPTLTDIITLDDLDEDEALALMAAVEQRSEHPLAGAIARAARARHVAVPPADDFQSFAGRGAQARVNGRLMWAGGPRMAQERTATVAAAVAALHADGCTALILGERDRAVAVFGVRDTIRADAAGLVGDLARVGVQRVVMLTGDSEPVARSVAQQTRVSQWLSGLLPEDKLDAITQLAQEGEVVAMIGDGVNDAPALAAARVGVAMGAAGSDVALHAADVALMSDRLDRLPTAIALARRARAIMRFNVIVSLAVKGALVLLVPFGLVTLILAVAADMGMSLLVTLNALRLLGRDTPQASERPAPVVPTACPDACCADHP